MSTDAPCFCSMCGGLSRYSRAQRHRHLKQYGSMHASESHDLGRAAPGPILFAEPPPDEDLEPSVDGADSDIESEPGLDVAIDEGALIHPPEEVPYQESLVILCQSMSALRCIGAAEKFIVEVSKAWASCLGSHLNLSPQEVDLLPTTAYKIDKLANNLREEEHHIVVKCAKCGTLNRGLSSGDVPRVCQCRTNVKKSSKVKSRNKFIMFDLTFWLSRLWGNPKIASLLHHNRDEGDGDVWDATIYNYLDRMHCMCFSITCDGATLQKTRNISWTPVILRLLNLPPHVRTTAGGMFLWAHLPHDIVIDKALSYMLKTVEHAWHNADGFEVYDAHTQSLRKIHIRLTRVIEDYAGMPNVIGNFKQPAVKGACPVCRTKGVNPNPHTHTSYYPCAVRYLPPDDPVRLQFVAEFDRVPKLKRLAGLDKPNVMSRRYALTEARKNVEDKEKGWKKVPAVALRDNDFVSMCLPDPAHALSHFVKDMHLLLGGEFDKKNDKKRKERGVDVRGWEIDDRQQFRNLRLAASSDNREKIDLLIEKSLRCPSEWVQLIPCLRSGNTAVRGLSVRISERLAHLSDAGKYIIALTDANVDVRKGFVQAITVLEELLRKQTMSVEMVKDLQLRLARALCNLEVLLPFKWNTISRHLLLHMPRKFLCHGSFWSCNMLAEERFHQTVRKLVHTSTTNLAASMGKNYTRFMNTHLDWGFRSSSPVKSHFLRRSMEYSDQRYIMFDSAWREQHDFVFCLLLFYFSFFFFCSREHASHGLCPVYKFQR